jgi:subfamily B ATP-binding cassette protein MsbA
MPDPDPVRKTDARKTYFRLIRLTRPYLWRLVVGVVCGALFAGSTTGLLAAMRDVLRRVFAQADLVAFAGFLVVMPLLALVRGLGQYLSDYYVQWVGNRVVMDLRIATFSHLQDLSVGFFSRSRTGDLISRTINDTMMIERAVSTVLGDLMTQPFVLVGAVGYALWLDARLALVSLVLFPICIVPIALFGRRVRHYAREGQARLGDIVSIMQEAVVGTRVVKAFGMEAHERARFEAQCRRFFNRITRVVRAKAGIEPIIVFISAVGLVLVLLYARWARMPAEDLITFAAAMVLLYEPVKKLSKIHLHIQQTAAAADRVFELLDAPVLIVDRPGARAFDEPLREIAFENVGFAYDLEPVLTGITLRVAAGQRVAIVGSSGSGKSTLVNLIPRFYDVTAGRVAINGTDLRDFTLASLRGRIGLVTQDIFLFNDTVANNIAYGRFDASRADLEEAARRAHAHEFVMALPEGYDTPIHERGVRLSGGQCQRLAIARAILRNPPILILDEATSALDTESERQVQDALEELIRGRTVFVIAHRLSTITTCDRILVLDQGRIVEDGTHRELLERNGVYRRLYDLQFTQA